MSVKPKHEGVGEGEQFVVPVPSFASLAKYVAMDEESLLKSALSVKRGNGLVAIRFEDALVEMKSPAKGIVVGDIYFYKVSGPYSKFITVHFEHEAFAGYSYVNTLKLVWFTPRGDGYELEKEEKLDANSAVRPHRRLEGGPRKVTYSELEALVKRLVNIYNTVVGHT